jgi:hypothetical protein
MTATAQPTARTEPSFDELAKRVDDAVHRVAELDDPARTVAEELKAALEAVHRAGLVTMVRRMRADDRAREVLFELVDEPGVRLLLSLHAIIRPDPVTEADRVLRAVRPQLQSHGGDVELASVAVRGVQRLLDVVGDAADHRGRGARDQRRGDQQGRGAAERAVPDAHPAG